MVYTVCYLGSTVFSTASLRNEINCRIGKAATTFSKLTKRAWQNKYVTEKTKVRIYQACVLSTLLYASEAWTTNTGQDKILNIKWQDRVSNYRVLEMAGLTSITTILSRLGYVYRMDNTCIPKKCLFGELSSGKRSQGRPKLHFKDVCKDTMRHLQIHPKSWERMASDQSAWRTAVRTGATLQEEMLRVEWERSKIKENRECVK